MHPFSALRSRLYRHASLFIIAHSWIQTNLTQKAHQSVSSSLINSLQCKINEWTKEQSVWVSLMAIPGDWNLTVLKEMYNINLLKMLLAQISLTPVHPWPRTSIYPVRVESAQQHLDWDKGRVALKANQILLPVHGTDRKHAEGRRGQSRWLWNVLPLLLGRSHHNAVPDLPGQSQLFQLSCKGRVLGSQHESVTAFAQQPCPVGLCPQLIHIKILPLLQGNSAHCSVHNFVWREARQWLLSILVWNCSSAEKRNRWKHRSEG